MTGTAATLLAAAQRVLDGSHPHRARMAAWLTRAALEQAVDARLATAGLLVGDASMRSRLTCLRVAVGQNDPELSERAVYAWDRLSAACHQHAYDLAPTSQEVRVLSAHVAQLTTRGPSHAASIQP